MEEDLHSKQQYLRREIMDQGYDPQDFNNFMCSIRQEESIDLNNWSIQEIVNVVESFKESLRKTDEEENQNEQPPSPVAEQIYNEEMPQNNDIPFKTGVNIHTEISRNTMQSLENQINNPVNNDPFENYQKVVPCQKLEKNELTYREDLYVTITEPVKINPGFFSFSYFQYTVKTYPLNYCVLRKVSDFSFLNQKLPLIHPAMYTPSLPHFAYGLKDDSPKKILYIQNYMNLLIENRFFRTLPIVYDFLTLPQPDWNKKIKSKYNKINEAMGFDSMPNLEGKYLIKITKADEEKANKIKAEINLKNEALVNLNSTLDELLAIIDKVSLCFKNVGLSFEQLQKRNNKNKVLNKGYENLSNLFKSWSKDYLTEKEFIRDEIKYYFKFINKEYTTFLKYFENYRMAHDHYKKTFERLKKAKNPSKEDIIELNDLKKYYGFELIQINDEYSNLEERLGKRLKKQFTKYYQNKDIIFQGYQKCLKLIKFEERYTLNEKLDKLENYINEYEEEIKNNKKEENDNNNQFNNEEKTNDQISNDYNNNCIEQNDKEEINQKIENNEKSNEINVKEIVNDKEEKENKDIKNIIIEDKKEEINKNIIEENENKKNEKEIKINDIEKEKQNIKEKEELNEKIENKELNKKEENNEVKKEKNKEEIKNEEIKENKKDSNEEGKKEEIKENKEEKKENKEELRENKEELRENKEEIKENKEKIKENKEEIKEKEEENKNEKNEAKKENENKFEENIKKD